MFLPAATQEKRRAVPGRARTALRTSSQPTEEPLMPPKLFFFKFRAVRGYGSASRAKDKAMGSAGSGSALRGPTRPGTAARAGLSQPGPRRPSARSEAVTGGGSAGTIPCGAASSHPAPHGHFPQGRRGPSSPQSRCPPCPDVPRRQGAAGPHSPRQMAVSGASAP